MKKLRILFFLLLACQMRIYAAPDTTTLVPVIVSGLIQDTWTGSGVPMHKVYFLTDSFSTVNVYDSVTTNANGYFFDTLLVPSNTFYLLQVYTFDCNNLMHDTLVGSPYYSFNVGFSICDAMPAVCQAGFSYLPNPTNPYSVNFTDNSSGNINQWFWNFGDNTTSNLQNPEHTYGAAGNYMVLLTVSDTTPGQFCMAVDTQFVVITAMPVYNLGGQVFGGFFPQTVGEVVLYKTIGTEYIAWDTAGLNANGVYYFYQIPAGDYVVKAFSPENPGIGQRYFPSYSPEEVFWQTASVLHLTQNQFNADIILKAVGQIATGAGFASGDVSLTTATFPIPLANVEVVLLDSNMQAVDYTITAADGTYEFYGIAPGTHFLRPEIPGKSCEAIAFQTGASIPDTTEIHLVVQGNPIGIEEPAAIYFASEVFPNPVSGNAAIELDMQKPAHGSLEIFDIAGRMIVQSATRLESGANTISLPLESLRNGLYLLRIQLNGEKPINRKFMLSKN